MAYTLTQAMSEHRFQVFTLNNDRLPEGENLNLLPLYKTRNPSILQKARIYWHILGRSSNNSNGVAHRVNGKPDLYHLIYRPTPISSHLSRLLPEFQHKPTVHTVPSVVTPGQLSPELFFARQLVAISRFAFRTLKNMGFENVTYIPPGIEVESWAGLAPRRNRLKSNLGLADKPILLYPGHYAPGYGIDLILHALPAIAADIPEVKILFACRLRSHADRLGEQGFQKEIAQLGLGRNVCFFNTVNNMRLLIGASDLTLLPLETMQDKVDIPITLLESLAAGVPVVVSDLAPMNELFHSTAREEETIGRVIPPGDANALAHAVIDLLKDSGLRSRLAKNGQAQVQEEYNLRHAACQYNRIYHELQGRHS